MSTLRPRRVDVQSEEKGDSKPPESKEEKPKAARNDQIIGEDGLIYYQGVTYEGERFLVPPSPDTVEAFYPWNLNIVMVTILVMLMVGLLSSLLGWFPRWVHVCLVVFWRCGYDVGIGWLLRQQSNHNWMVNMYKQCTKDPNSALAKFIFHLVKCNLPKGHKKEPSDYPAPFAAWLAFRHVANIILINDAFNFGFLGLASITFPPSLGLFEIVQYAAGLGLILFNAWAKVDAHRCIGDYCWYWGDFFFRKDQQLTFDGIFELFPHPMYTVGYSLYYGWSLITRSYTMLFVSLFCHLMQIAFLVQVEEPHIEKIYGRAEPELDAERYRALYDPRTGLFPKGSKDTGIWWYWNPCSFTDLVILVLSIYTIAVALLVRDPYWAALQVVIWRLLHWGGLGTLLFKQSHSQSWTRRFLINGRNLNESFEMWKRLYKTSLVVNWIAFSACACRYLALDFQLPGDLFAGKPMACLALGGVLLLVNYWSSLSTYKTVGDFGWYYGDFFIPTYAYQNNLIYTGIYRFLNNPDCYTGYAGLYGMALASRSWVVFGLALFAQTLNLLFLYIVEIPHMKKLYEQRGLREHGGLSKAINTKIRQVGTKIVKPIRKRVERVRLPPELERIRLDTLRQTFEEYKKLAESKAQKLRELTTRQVRVPETVFIGDDLTVEFETTSDHDATDWIGVYDADVPSAPGQSSAWVTVPAGPKGTVVIPAAKLPQREGIFEIRYHDKGGYEVVAAQYYRVERREEDDQEHEEEEEEEDGDGERPE